VGLKRLAGYGYAVFAAGAVAFQLALASGAPWGSYAMGGTESGQFSGPLRVAAVVQAAVLILLALVVLSRAGIILPRLYRVSRWVVWIVVAVAAIGLVLNLITPSAGERAVWAPVTLVMLVCGVLVALARPAPKATGLLDRQADRM
jgi:hypothetical protein